MSRLKSSTPIGKILDTEKLLNERAFNFLLGNVKKSVEYWFLTGMRHISINSAPVSYDQIMTACVDVLMHDFMPNLAFQFQTSINNESEVKTILSKLHDDFEWLCRSAQIRNLQLMESSKTTSITTKSFVASKSIQEFLHKWILSNLQGNSLCAALQTLLCEKDLLEHYYPRRSAFMRHESYATAFLICLSAIELNQYSLISQIDPELYAPQKRLNNSDRMPHRRTNSHPDFSISPPKHNRPKLSLINDSSSTCTGTENMRFRKTKSLPELHTSSFEIIYNMDTLPRQRSKTFGAVNKFQFYKNIKNNTIITTTPNEYQSASNSTLDSEFLLHIPSSRSTKESLSCGSSLISSANSSSNNSSYTTARKVRIINCDNIKIWTDQNWDSEQNHRSPNQKPSQQLTTPPCEIPNSIKSISPIQSFLTNIYGTPSAENCSWSEQEASCSQQNVTVCEIHLTEDMVINPSSAQNTVNFMNYIEPETSKGSVFESFLPVYGTKLRAQNSESFFETGISYLDYSQPSPSNCAVGDASDFNERQITASAGDKNCETLTEFLQMSKLSRNNTALEKENAHFRISEAIISAMEHIKWAKLQGEQSDSIKPLVTEAQEEYIPFAEVNGVEEFADQHSAEVVGLSLLSKFNETQLPKVSELKWLVSEEDTPQQLLPLPDQIGNNPDDHFVPSLTRGTRYWAPPRPQIIFTDHPSPNRKQLVQKQNNRCAGCGMVVSAQYVHSFRYCTYLGKYHCTGCHRNQMSATPAKILQNWDFKCYPVSSFAYHLLEQIYICPLFHVPDLNVALYEKQSSLRKTRCKRKQLHYVRDFIRTCRFATREQQYFERVPEYLTSDPDVWSLRDLTDTYNKVMQRTIDDLIGRCENHIFHCVLCTARGFLCEYCEKNDIIYPWQIHRIYRCDYCGACYHKKCWTAGMKAKCLRCQRLRNRSSENDESMIKGKT